MLEFSSKIAIYLILMASGWNHTQPKPIGIKAIKNTDTEQQQLNIDPELGIGDKTLDVFNRAQRQVVAPEWLNPKTPQIIDGRVRVTDQSLREAEALRKAIQKTIDEDTFAIANDQIAPNPVQNPTKQRQEHLPAIPTQNINNNANNVMHQISKYFFNLFGNRPLLLSKSNQPAESIPVLPQPKSSDVEPETADVPQTIDLNFESSSETTQPTSNVNQEMADVPQQTTDLNFGMNEFGKQWLNVFQESQNIWSDKKMWREIKKQWFDFIDSSQKFWTDII